MKATFRTAVLFDEAVDDVEPLLTTALERRGFIVKTSHDESNLERVHITLKGYDDRTRNLRLTSEVSMMGLARHLASELSAALQVHQVEVRDKLVETSGGSERYWASTRSEEVAADGSTRGLGEILDVDAIGADKGSSEDTAHYLLWALLEELPPRPDPRRTDERTLEFVRPPDGDQLPERVRHVLVLAEEAEDVFLTEVMGQQAVRIVLPDGSKQMSVLSAEELEQFRTHFDL